MELEWIINKFVCFSLRCHHEFLTVNVVLALEVKEVFGLDIA